MTNSVAASESAVGTKPGRALHVVLWVVQGLLALAFGAAGFMKSTAPVEALAENLPWVSSLPGLVRFIGISELLGALGLILPAATRIRPGLTALAAVGLVAIMVLAAIFHVSRAEISGVGITFILGALAAFVAWGRWRKAPIAPRG